MLRVSAAEILTLAIFYDLARLHGSPVETLARSHESPRVAGEAGDLIGGERRSESLQLWVNF